MNPPARPSPGGLAANAPRERHYTPGEFSAALAGYGITLCTRLVRERCALPASAALRISTNPEFPGRLFIPEGELIRLVTARKNNRHE
jgi:hypothetical protein